MDDSYLRIGRPRIVSIRRKDFDNISVGDEAVAEVGPGLQRFLCLQGAGGTRLGDGFAPEWTITFGAAGTAAVFISSTPYSDARYGWTMVTCSIKWTRPVRTDETILATSRIDSMGRTSVGHSYRVVSKERGDIIATGTMVIVSVAAGGPSAFDVSLKKPITQVSPGQSQAPSGPPSDTNPGVSQTRPLEMEAAEISTPSGVLANFLPFLRRKTFKSEQPNLPPVLRIIRSPTILELGSAAEIQLEVCGTNRLPYDCELSVETPYGFGLDFEWNGSTRFRLPAGESTNVSGVVRALRPEEVNLGKPWPLHFVLLRNGEVVARISTEISVPDPSPGRILYVLTEDCETFDGGEKTGKYGELGMLGNQNNFMDPEDYRVQMINKPNALNAIAEKHGARWTHFWTATQRFAAQWALEHSSSEAWKTIVEDLDQSVRQGSRHHEYAPHIHFDFEPDSKLNPQPRLLYDAETDGILPNEYYDPVTNPDHKFHGWDGARKGIAYVKREGNFQDPDSKSGSLRKSARHLARLAVGGKVSFTTRTGAADFGFTREDLDKSSRASMANGFIANSDAGVYEPSQGHPRGRQIYFCRSDDLEKEIGNLNDANLVQLRSGPVTLDGGTLAQLNEWFDLRVRECSDPGVHAIVVMTHAMFLKGEPEVYRDTVGGDFEKIHQHLQYVRERYPNVEFVTATDAVLEFLDYYSPKPCAVTSDLSSPSPDGRSLLCPIRILGKGIPLSASHPGMTNVSAPTFLDSEEIQMLRVLKDGELIVSAVPLNDRLSQVGFSVISREGYELEIHTSSDVSPLFAERLQSETKRHELASESEQPNLFRLDRPRLLQKTVQGASPATGDFSEWHFSGDLLLLLVNPIGGGTEPLGRRVHPYSGVLLGGGLYAGYDLLGTAAQPISMLLNCLHPLTPGREMRLRCVVDQVDGAEIITKSVVHIGTEEVANMQLAFRLS